MVCDEHRFVPCALQFTSATTALKVERKIIFPHDENISNSTLLLLGFGALAAPHEVALNLCALHRPAFEHTRARVPS